MSDIERKRDVVSNMYSSPNWKRRVKNMPDNQVIAIYFKQQLSTVAQVKSNVDKHNPPF